MTVLDRLSASDPARDDALPPDEQLLQRLLAEPRTPPPRRRLPVRRLAAVAVAATVAGVVVASGGSPSPDLAARAYAQTSAGAQILYARTRWETTRTSPRGTERETSTTEYWTSGDRAFYRVVSKAAGHPTTTFELASNDGAIRVRDGGGAWRPVPGSADTDHLQRGYVAEFRRLYEAGQLDTGGGATFASRDAKRYVVTDQYGRSEYYVDAETAAPLGVIRVFPYKSTPEGPVDSAQRTVETVEQLDELEPTPENLAKLT